MRRWPGSPTGRTSRDDVPPPADDPAADYRLRIWTPDRELPFAGHPTLGSAHAWLEAGGWPRNDDRARPGVRGRPGADPAGPAAGLRGAAAAAFRPGRRPPTGPGSPRRCASPTQTSSTSRGSTTDPAGSPASSTRRRRCWPAGPTTARSATSRSASSGRTPTRPRRGRRRGAGVRALDGHRRGPGDRQPQRRHRPVAGRRPSSRRRTSPRRGPSSGAAAGCTSSGRGTRSGSVATRSPPSPARSGSEA